MKRNKKGQFVSPLRPYLFTGLVGALLIFVYGISVRADVVTYEKVVTEVEADRQEIILQHYLDKLEQCESSGDYMNENLEWDGWVSRGSFQFRYNTAQYYLDKYGLYQDLEKEDIINLLHTKEWSRWLAREIVTREGHTRDWKICSKRVGIDDYIENWYERD